MPAGLSRKVGRARDRPWVPNAPSCAFQPSPHPSLLQPGGKEQELLGSPAQPGPGTVGQRQGAARHGVTLGGGPQEPRVGCGAEDTRAGTSRARGGAPPEHRPPVLRFPTGPWGRGRPEFWLAWVTVRGFRVGLLLSAAGGRVR